MMMLLRMHAYLIPRFDLSRFTPGTSDSEAPDFGARPEESVASLSLVPGVSQCKPDVEVAHLAESPLTLTPLTLSPEYGGEGTRGICNIAAEDVIGG
jgi:hypothetical protein